MTCSHKKCFLRYIIRPKELGNKSEKRCLSKNKKHKKFLSLIFVVIFGFEKNDYAERGISIKP